MDGIVLKTRAVNPAYTNAPNETLSKDDLAILAAHMKYVKSFFEPDDADTHENAVARKAVAIVERLVGVVL